MFAASKTASASTGGYQISRSLRFNSADSAYLNRTPASAGNRRTWTLSTWIKRSKISNSSEYSYFATAGTSGSNSTNLLFNLQNNLRFENVISSTTINCVTDAVFRDPSAWYHVVIAVDTTQATNTNGVKIYVNGVQQTLSFTVYTQNSDTYFNSTNQQGIGLGYAADQYFNGLQTEMYLIDGSQLTPSSFGETNAQTGVWQPKAYSGSYGTNGFYLNFSDNSNTTAATLGKDYSGNGNNWTPNNFSVTAGIGNDSLVDSPTSYGTTDTGVGGEIRGNYCTFNPLFKLGGTTALTWALNGNLQAKSDSNASMVVYGTMGLDPSTKFYNEFTMTNTVEVNDHVGIVTDIQAAADGGTCVAYKADGQKIVNGTTSAYGATYTDNDVIGIAVDLVNNQVTFYKNGTSQGTITGVTSATYFHRVRFNNLAGQQAEVYGNWGQRPFAYTAPSGFKALCTQNLPTPTIGATTATQANQYFTPVLYSGNGASSRAVTGVGFQPDFVWLKARNYAFVNGLFDAVRGGNKLLISNLTSAEITNEVNGYLSAFNSDGFTLTAGATNNDTFNGSANSMVSWNWKANGSGSSNTSGSITSTVSANTTSGFSVVTYTGTGANATVGHGLGIAPSMYIVKSRSAAGPWPVYHSTVGNNGNLVLNGISSTTVSSTIWNATSPTSSVFSVGINTDSNTVTTTYVAYCFAEVSGYSKISSYTGNGSADGPFIYCGFRPAYIMVKASNFAGSTNWVIKDKSRPVYNASNLNLFANLSISETTEYPFDFVSNGFKVRDSGGDVNGSGTTYIFMAFAEAPLKFSLAR